MQFEGHTDVAMRGSVGDSPCYSPVQQTVSNLKICMIVHQYYYRDGRVRRYAESLAAAGARVDVVGLRDPGYKEAGKRSGLRTYEIPLARAYHGIGSYIVEYALALFLFFWKLLGLYIRNHYDVIHVHNMPDVLVLSALIPRVLGAKVILDIHDPMPEFYSSKFSSDFSALSVRALQFEEKLMTKLADAIITANLNFARSLAQRGVPANKITVVNNVADGEIFNRARCAHLRQAERTHYTLIYPGTIAERYALDVAIRALPALRNDIPEIRLVILGTQVSHTQDLKRLAVQLGVEPLVEFRPPVPIEKVPCEMAMADAGIYTAIPDAHMDIATPSKVLEFAAMGLPIIASRLTVLEQLFDKDSVLFFEPGNVAEFSNSVRRLYDSPSLAEAMVRNMDVQYVQNRSWEQEFQEYTELLYRLSQ